MYPTLLTFNEDRPIVFTTWVDAAAYCNWLSKEEGIDPKEWCYETDPAGKIGMKVPIVKIRENYLSLRGYRLPTEAEIEYATRGRGDEPVLRGDRGVAAEVCVVFDKRTARHVAGWNVEAE